MHMKLSEIISSAQNQIIRLFYTDGSYAFLKLKTDNKRWFVTMVSVQNVLKSH